MNLTLLSALNFFRKKNRFRVTAKLAEKTSLSTVRPRVECIPIGSPEYHIAHMDANDSQLKEDFLSNIQRDGHGLNDARTAAAAGQSRWHKNKYTQEYQLDHAELDPKIEIYYQKLGLGKVTRKTKLGDPGDLSWDT